MIAITLGVGAKSLGFGARDWQYYAISGGGLLLAIVLYLWYRVIVLKRAYAQSKDKKRNGRR